MTDLAYIGFAMIVIGIALVVASSFSGQKDMKFAVGGVVGFIPFGFGNDPQIVKATIIISVVLAVLLLIFFMKGFA